MTTLVIDEVKAVTLEQKFTITEKIIVGFIRPYLYVHNTPAGTFTLSLTTTADAVLSSGTFTAAAIYTGLGTAYVYAYAWMKVTLANPVPLVAGTYKIKISASGYTFAENAYLGWIKEHEDIKNAVGYSPANDLLNPRSYEIWSYKI